MTPLIGPGPLQALQTEPSGAWYLAKEKDKPEKREETLGAGHLVGGAELKTC